MYIFHYITDGCGDVLEGFNLTCETYVLKLAFVKGMFYSGFIKNE